MTYPNYPQQPQPQYPQQPGFPPQYPAYPPQNQYPAPPPPPQQQPANLDIDSFYDQPAASGKSISSWFQTPGQSITGIIARAISKADVRLQTDMQTKQPLPPRPDGSYRTTMTIPLLVQPSPDFPDGRAAWIVSPSDRPDLEMAMEAAGCPPKTVPEAGATITITYTGNKQIPGFGVPKKLKTITYQRPQGQGQAENPTTPIPSATASAPGTAPATWAPPATAGYPAAQVPVTAPPAPPVTAPYATQPGYPPAAYPNGQAAQDMVTGNGAYAPQAPGVQWGQQQAPAPNGPYGQPGADWNPAAPQYQQQPVPPTPAATAPGAMPSAAAPPAGAPSPSSGYAVPSNLTPEQEERLRQLTGQ